MKIVDFWVNVQRAWCVSAEILTLIVEELSPWHFIKY
jgi:hypothetical protein